MFDRDGVATKAITVVLTVAMVTMSLPTQALSEAVPTEDTLSAQSEVAQSEQVQEEATSTSQESSAVESSSSAVEDASTNSEKATESTDITNSSTKQESTATEGTTDEASSTTTATDAAADTTDDATAAKTDDTAAKTETSSSTEAITTQQTAGYHTVTTIVDGVTIKTETVKDGDTATRQDNPAIPANKVQFTGWYVQDASGNISSTVYDFSTPVTSDLTLVAQFDDVWYVKFENANGQVTTTQRVHDGDSATAATGPDAPTGKVFDCWYDEITGAAYEFSSAVTSNVTLKPHFVDLHYVYFTTHGSSVDAQAVKDGSNATEPASPTRSGYTFSHWSTTKDDSTGAFDFANTSITSNTELFAIWTPEQVNYTVTYWFEKPNIAGKVDHDPSNYAYDQSQTLQAPAGSTVSADDIKDQLSPTSDDMTKYGAYSFSSTTTVLGNGTSVLNVYYTRNSYTVEFDLGDIEGRTMTFNGTTYQSGANAAKYTFTAKYQQDITNLWASTKNATFDGGDYGFDAWTANGWSYRYATHRLIMNADIILGAKSNGVITAIASWEKGFSNIQVNYWLEVTPGVTPTGETTQMTFNGVTKTYEKSTDYSQKLSTTTNSKFSAKSIRGVTYVGGDSGQHVAADKTFNFYYDRSSYTLSFDSQGGSAVASATGIMYGESTQSYKPADPKRENYVFRGWYTTADLTTKYDFSSAMTDHDVMLYAKWEPSQYTAYFLKHQGDNPETAVAKQGLAEGDYVKDPDTYVVGKSYEGLGEFQGWYWKVPGTDVVRAYDYDVPVSGDVTLFAIWKTDGFKVTYDKGEGTGTAPVDAKEYTLGSITPVLSGSTLTPPENKVFVGWQVDGAWRLYLPGSAIKLSGSVTLVAYYVDPSTAVDVTFNSNFGTDPETSSSLVEKNTYLTMPPYEFSARTGYTFAGWNTKADGTGVTHVPNDASTGAAFIGQKTTFYAKWAAKTDVSYTVRYVDASGNELAPSKSVTDQTFDSTVTENAIAIDGYRARTSRQEVKLDAYNKVIIFVYDPVTPPVVPAPIVPTTPTTPTTPTRPTNGLVTRTAPTTATTPDAAADQTTVAAEATPLAATPAETIADEATPLAENKPVCWVHWVMGLGAILTVIYGIAVTIRRRRFTKDLHDRKDHVLGNDKDDQPDEGASTTTIPAGEGA
ncbi:MAG: InlB B-repeat-containing protein [Atopobiaceae bacterium]|nr:InlB B-repeat-containing protein [Atopobiaceae bacterium]MCI2207529.1 InlB B-repeat-containing protein [Atopobiaceae bacterium]